MTRWYRAYAGTVKDDKIAEVASVAGCSRSVAIATWHALLESAAEAGGGGQYETTPRRVAALLGEAPAAIESVFAAMTEIGMIGDNSILAWKRRQFESDSSTERSRKHRETKRNGGATLQRRSATPPEAEAEAEEVQEIITDPLRQAETFVGSQAKPTDAGQSEIQKTKPIRARTPYPDDFEGFWSGYPTDANMSKKEAFDVWKRISRENRELAVESLPAFRAHCSSHPDYRPIHACRYLAKERFVGHVATAKKLEARRFIEQGTPQWEAWQTHNKSVYGKGTPVAMGSINGRSCQGWTFDSEWPPTSTISALPDRKQKNQAA